jgi:hypothetical protein
MEIARVALRPRSGSWFFLIIALVAMPRDVFGQDIIIPRIDQPIDVDGQVREQIWLEVPPLPITMFEPEFRAPITRTSTIRLAHDGRYLYAAGVFVDDAAPTANSLIRDHYAEDDLFNLVIDSFNDDETAFYFLVTPAGTRVDGAITDDVEGPGWQHEEFDNVWDAAAVRTPDGWSAEMRIPFSSLRFRADDGVVRLGLIAGRLIVRLRERHTFPAIEPGPSIAQFKPSLAATVVLEGVESRRPLELRPYTLGGWSATSRPELIASGGSYEVGGDAKVAVGPRMTLDITANTDFAQTEADAVQVNLDRFSLFIPEKRQFFLERAGVFAFGYADEHQLFYSRRVGLSSAGAPERIYGGARATGRIGRGDVGALSLQVEREAGGSANLTAVRYRHPFLRGASYVGGIATSLLEPGTDSFAFGFDTQVDLAGSRFANAAFSLSRDDNRNVATHIRLAAEKRNRAGLSYRVAAVQTDAAYQPPLGFVRRTGMQQIEGHIFHGSFGRAGALQESLFAGSTQWVRRSADGALETATLAASWNGRRRGGGTGFIQLVGRHENVLHEFALGENALVPAGDYQFLELAASIGLPDGWARRAHLEFSGGRFFDGRRFTVALRPVWNVSSHLELGADLEANRVSFPSRDQTFKADIARFRFRAAVNTHLSAYGLVQYDGVSRQVGSNVRLRVHVSEGRDVYLVWNEAHDVPVEDAPTAGRFNRRSLTLKYTHALWW